MAQQNVGPGPIVGGPIQNKVTVTQKLSIVLSVLSAVLASAGFGSDFWLVYDTDEDVVLHSGLFRTCFGPFCISHISELIKEPAWIVEVISGLAGIGLMGLASILKVFTIYKHHASRTMAALDLFCVFVGTICMAILLGTLIGTTTNLPASYSWSMYIFCVGIAFGLGSAILTFMNFSSTRA